MASAPHHCTDRERTPTAVSAEILKEAERLGYPVELFKVKISEMTTPGPLPAYATIIKHTEAILNTQEKLNKIRGEIACYDLCNPCMATHPTLIEKKIQRLADELHRMRAIIEFKSEIHAGLRTCNVHSSLPIERKHHKAVLELFKIMPKMIEEFRENVDNLEWFLNFQPNRNIERISTVVTQTFSQLQHTTKHLREFHAILKRVHDIRCTNKSEDEVRRYNIEDTSGNLFDSDL